MTLRIGLVGCGAIARRAHLPAFRAVGPELADVRMFASRSPASAEAAAKEWGSGVVEPDWRRLVESSEIDAVDICSPNRSHAPIAIAAAEAGKHVLVEKPMACSVAEADAMIEAATRSGVVLSIAHNLRDNPVFFTAHGLVRSGAIGDVVGFRDAFGHGGPQAWAPEATWFFDTEESGGGALIDLGIHAADMVRFVLGDDAKDVFAMLSPTEGIDMAAQVVVRLVGGAIGSIHASWTARPGPDHQLTVFGTEATLHFDSRTPLTILRADHKPERIEPAGPDVGVYAAFVQACLGHGAPSVNALDGRAALAIVEAAYQSARSGHMTSPAAALR